GLCQAHADVSPCSSPRCCRRRRWHASVNFGPGPYSGWATRVARVCASAAKSCRRPRSPPATPAPGAGLGGASAELPFEAFCPPGPEQAAPAAPCARRANGERHERLVTPSSARAAHFSREAAKLLENFFSVLSSFSVSSSVST